MLELAALWDRAAADEGCERRGSGDNGAIFSGHQAKDDTARRRGGPSGVGRVAAGASAFVCSCSRASPLSFACAQPPRPGGACLAWPGRALHLPHSRAATRQLSAPPLTSSPSIWPALLFHLLLVSPPAALPRAPPAAHHRRLWYVASFCFSAHLSAPATATRSPISICRESLSVSGFM